MAMESVNKGVIKRMVDKTLQDTVKGFIGEVKQQQLEHKIREVANTLSSNIFDIVMPKPKGIKEHIVFFFKHLPKGIAIYSLQYLFQTTLLYIGMKIWLPLPFVTCLGIFITLRALRSGIVELKPHLHYDKKPNKITIGFLRDLEKQVNAGDISYSRMVELINEKVNAKEKNVVNS